MVGGIAQIHQINKFQVAPLKQQKLSFCVTLHSQATFLVERFLEKRVHRAEKDTENQRFEPKPDILEQIS